MSSSIPKIIGNDALRAFKDPIRSLREVKKVDPRERYVLLIPEARAAYVGMGFKLLNESMSEQVFEQASNILNRDILKLCLDGPKLTLLGSMENMHIATFVTSHATLEKMRHNEPYVFERSKAAGGIGIGFINALVLSGAMSFENGLDLVQRMGQAMDRISEVVPSGQLKILLRPATSKSLVCSAARDHCKKLGIPAEISVCDIVRQNPAQHIAIAGHEEAIKFLELEGERLFGFKWISRMEKDPKAYHTRLMKPAQDFISAYIEGRMKDDPSYIKEPETCSTYSSTAGFRLRSIKHIKKDLAEYPVKTIKVEQLLQTLYKRPRSVPQPNTIVLWDRSLLRKLDSVNRLARARANLYR